MLKCNVVNSVGTAVTTIQTVGTGNVHIVLTIVAKNKTANSIGGRVYLEKASGATMDLIANVPQWLPYENQMWEGKLFLEAGDMIKCVSDTETSVDVMTSYVEKVNN